MPTVHEYVHEMEDEFIQAGIYVVAEVWNTHIVEYTSCWFHKEILTIYLKCDYV